MSRDESSNSGGSSKGEVSYLANTEDNVEIRWLGGSLRTTVNWAEHSIQLWIDAGGGQQLYMKIVEGVLVESSEGASVLGQHTVTCTRCSIKYPLEPGATHVECPSCGSRAEIPPETQQQIARDRALRSGVLMGSPSSELN